MNRFKKSTLFIGNLGKLKLIYSLVWLFSDSLALPFPFFTIGNRIFLVRILPFCQPGDGAFKDSNSIRVTAPRENLDKVGQASLLQGFESDNFSVSGDKIPPFWDKYTIFKRKIGGILVREGGLQ